MPEESLESQQEANIVTQTPDALRAASLIGRPPINPLNLPGLNVPVLDFEKKLRGRARLQDLITRNKGYHGKGVWSKEFNQWILAQATDSLDEEYTRALSQTQETARRIERGDKVDRARLPWLDQAAQPKRTRPDAATDEEQLRAEKPKSPLQAKPLTEEQQLREEKAYGAKWTQNSVFYGNPMTERSAWSGKDDTELAKWMAREGKELGGNQAQFARTSGAFAYMGPSPASSVNEVGRRNETWMYTTTANGGLVVQGKDKVKAYQKRWGEPETGIPSDQMQNLWEKAVQHSQLYAQANIKVSVQEIFDSWLAQAEADRAAKKAAGGGRSSGLEESAVDMAAVDYYRGMMQVLGDISGVSSGT